MSLFRREHEHEFVDVPIRDNFYQTSGFFPMPVVLVSTLSPSGATNLGPYSLCFPHLIAGRHAMMLISRSDSNTAQNLERTGVCALSFIPDDKDLLAATVELGFPGETTAEKMARSPFTLRPSTRAGAGPYPEIVGEAVQVFECRWDASHAHRASAIESHFLLDIEKILLQRRWSEALEEGRGFPRLPVDYGYRDNVHFWFAQASRPFAIDVPKGRGVDVDSVVYFCQRFDPGLTWEHAACERLVNVPRIFLKAAVRAVAEEARARGVTRIDAEMVEAVRAKHRR